MRRWWRIRMIRSWMRWEVRVIGRRLRVEKEDRMVMRIYKCQLCPIDVLLKVADLVGQCPNPSAFVRHGVDLYIHNKRNDKNKDTIPPRPRFQMAGFKSYYIRYGRVSIGPQCTNKVRLASGLRVKKPNPVKLKWRARLAD